MCFKDHKRYFFEQSQIFCTIYAMLMNRLNTTIFCQIIALYDKQSGNAPLLMSDI